MDNRIDIDVTGNNKLDVKIKVKETDECLQAHISISSDVAQYK